MAINTVNGIKANEKPTSDNMSYVYAENDKKEFVRIQKDVLKMILGIPTKLSELNNDKGFVDKMVNDLENYYLKSETYTRDEIDNKLSLVPRFSVKVVSTLPTEGISETTVYLVPSGEDEYSLYTEYINVDGLWEILGTQKYAFSGNASDVIYDDSETNLGADNVQGAIGKLSETVNDHKYNTDIHVTSAEKQAWNNKSNFSGSYNDLTDKPQIPEGADLTGYAKESFVKEYAQPKGEYLTPSNLSNAVNTALEQAKASGDFKGDKGDDGYTPQKGVDYFDGEDGKTPVKGTDYFTEADKQEIVDDVLEQVEIPNGGGSSGSNNEMEHIITKVYENITIVEDSETLADFNILDYEELIIRTTVYVEDNTEENNISLQNVRIAGLLSAYYQSYKPTASYKKLYTSHKIRIFKNEDGDIGRFFSSKYSSSTNELYSVNNAGQNIEQNKHWILEGDFLKVQNFNMYKTQIRIQLSHEVTSFTIEIYGKKR